MAFDPKKYQNSDTRQLAIDLMAAISAGAGAGGGTPTNADLTNLKFEGADAGASYTLYDAWCTANPTFTIVTQFDYINNNGILAIAIRYKTT